MKYFRYVNKSECEFTPNFEAIREHERKLGLDESTNEEILEDSRIMRETIPAETFYEINKIRWQKRRVDLYKSGELGYADKNGQTLFYGLAEREMPTIEEFYNSIDCNGDVIEITKDEFEKMWKKAQVFCEKSNIKINYYEYYNNPMIDDKYDD